MGKDIKVQIYNIENVSIPDDKYTTESSDLKGLYEELRNKFHLSFEIRELCFSLNSNMTDDYDSTINANDTIEIFPPFTGG
jgi:molybdopterin converting factor small subunit